MNTSKNKFLVATCWVLISVNTVVAQDRVNTLSLDDIQSIAIGENKGLLSARFLIRAAEGRLRQSGLWPNPELELARTSDRSFNNEGEYTGSVGFNQKFPISGRIARAKNVARVDVAQAAAEVRNQERLLLGEVLKNSRNLLVFDEKLGLNEHSQNILSGLISASQKRLKQAEISSVDVNLERIELQKLSFRASALRIEREQTRIALNVLLSRPPQELITVTGSVKFETDLSNLKISVEEAIALRPDRQMAALAINRAAAEAKLAKAERFEDWTVGFGYDRDISKFDSSVVVNQKDDFLGLRLTIPLPLWNQNQGKIAEASANQSRAEVELSALDLKISAEIETARSEIQRLLPVLKQYENEALKLSEDNARMLQRSYADGLVPISAVIQAQQQLFEIQEAYTDSLITFFQASTELQTALASNPFLQRSSK